MEFRGLFPPVITPFRDGRVDPESIERLVESCAPHLRVSSSPGAPEKVPA